MALLGAEEIAAAAENLPGWDASPDGLRRIFHFASFSEAFRFMTLCAASAEAANHHPDWSNSYGTVCVVLRTHSEGGVTAKDISLAAEFSRAWEQVSREST
ncbi:MAG: 4a-hydroxytetrahydrobiopterin dehydratase [Terrimicrobiaceae bacterium]